MRAWALVLAVVSAPLAAQVLPSSPENLRLLRERNASFAKWSDEPLARIVEILPKDYLWSPSDTLPRGAVGVLVFALGSASSGDQTFQHTLAPAASSLPMIAVFGMALRRSDHIQSAVDRLTAAGAKKIVAVPVVATEYTSLLRQWEYVLGHRKQAAYLDVPQVKASVPILTTPVMAGHRLMPKILADHAREMSADPAKEVVILVGHGPTPADENAIELKVMEKIASDIRTQGGFSEARALNLQDDAPKEVRGANEATLRRWIEAINASGKTPLVVGFLMFSDGAQKEIRESLTGLSYKLSPKGISEHPAFAEWVRESVATAAR